MSKIHISSELLASLRKHCEQTYPYESCGVLLGVTEPEGWILKAIVPAGNTRTDSAHNRYHIAPGDLVKIERQARSQGLSIAGFYHSHPDHPAQWSKTDLEEAHWFGCVYIITEVRAGVAATTNSFLLAGVSEEEKHFLQQQIIEEL